MRLSLWFQSNLFWDLKTSEDKMKNMEKKTSVQNHPHADTLKKAQKRLHVSTMIPTLWGSSGTFSDSDNSNEVRLEKELDGHGSHGMSWLSAEADHGFCQDSKHWGSFIKTISKQKGNAFGYALNKIICRCFFLKSFQTWELSTLLRIFQIQQFYVPAASGAMLWTLIKNQNRKQKTWKTKENYNSFQFSSLFNP